MTRCDEGLNPAGVNINTINTDPRGAGGGHVWRCWQGGTRRVQRRVDTRTHTHPVSDFIVPVLRAAYVTLGP